jgi:hypothetical protein
MSESHLDLIGLNNPKELYLETVLVEEGKGRTIIVSPKGDDYIHLAKGIQDKIWECSGALVPIIGDSLYSKSEHQRCNAIMLGNICVNRALIPLYHLYYVLTDGDYPGRGGYEVRTVHDPWGLGTNVVLLGGSDIEGVKESVKVFMSLIKSGRTISLKRLLLVKLGENLRGRSDCPTSPPTDDNIRLLQDTAKQAMVTEAHRNLAPYIAYIGFMYYRTGYEFYAQLFKEWVYMWENYSKQPMTSTRKRFGRWGFDADFCLFLVMPAWDLVEESPVFTDEDRLRITRILVRYIRDCVPHVGDVSRDVLRFNHKTFAALGLLYSGIYFTKYYDSKEAERWLKIVERCFSPQVRAFKAYEDSNAYQWVNLHHTLKYSFVKPDPTFFELGNAKKAADYAIITMDNLGYPVPYGDVGSWQGHPVNVIPFLEGVAFRLGDGRYQQVLERKRSLCKSYVDIGEYEINHYRCDIESYEPEDLLGVVCFPLEKAFFDLFKEGSMTSHEKTFDKISFRTSFDRDKQYLLLGGLSRGGHSHYDGNAILRITGKGRTFLDDCDYIRSYPKYHNTLLVIKDGWSSMLPAFCELEHLADLGELGFSQSSLKDYSGVDWFRSVVWKKEKYFIVIDEMAARESSDYDFHCIWRVVGDLEVSDEGVSVDQKGVRFWLKTPGNNPINFEEDVEAGANWQGYPYAEPLVHVIREVFDGKLDADERQRIFNLLYISEERDEPYHISRVSGSSVAISGGEAAYIGLGEGGSPSIVRAQMRKTSPTTDASLYYIAPEDYALVKATRLTWIERLFESDEPVSIEFNLRTGEGVLTASSKTRLRFLSGGLNTARVLIDGEETETCKVGKLTQFTVEQGKHQIRIPDLKNQPLITRLKEDFTSAQTIAERRMRQTVKPIEPKHIEGVWCWRIAGNGNRFSSLFLADINRDGKSEILAGSTDGWVYAIKGDGSLSWKFKTDGKVNSIWAKDIDRDGLEEVVVGSSDANVYVLCSDGTKRWNYALEYHMQKAVVTTVFSYDLDGDGKDEVIAGSENWRYYAFDHSGALRWFHESARRSTVGCAADIDNDGKGEVIAGTEYYWWTAIDHKGEKKWSYGTGNGHGGPGVNSVAVADLDGDGTREVIFGGRDGNIHVWTHDSKFHRMYNVGDEVTRVIGVDFDEDGKDEIVAGGMNFNIYVLKGDGTRLWRRNMGDRVTSLAVSNLFGDSGKDVIVGLADGTIRILGREGEEWGCYATGSEVLDLAVADIDGDGVNEIVGIMNDGSIHALKPQKHTREGCGIE